MSNAPVILAIWNDIVPERIEEYEAWHTLEHVPERVWVPGFIGATRYLALGDAAPRYLTLYETDSVDTLKSPAYVDLVEHPTNWSASMRPSFRNFLRQPCVVVASAGNSAGAWTLASRFALPSRSSVAHLSTITQTLLKAGAKHCVTSVQLGEVLDVSPQALENATANQGGIEYLLIVQSALGPGESDLRTLVQQATQALLGNSIYQIHGVYRFASRVEHEAVKAPTRPPQRTDLMSQWQPV